MRFSHNHKIFAAACFLIVRQILSDPQIFIIAQIFIIVTQIPAIIRTKKIFKNFLRFLQQFGRNDLLYR